MARRTTQPPLPALREKLRALGENIRLARLRRRLTATLLAERAGISRPTLQSVERGEPGVTLGAYANVLFSLGLADDLVQLGREDALGRDLQDAELPKRPRPRRSRRGR